MKSLFSLLAIACIGFVCTSGASADVIESGESIVLVDVVSLSADNCIDNSGTVALAVERSFPYKRLEVLPHSLIEELEYFDYLITHISIEPDLGSVEYHRRTTNSSHTVSDYRQDTFKKVYRLARDGLKCA